MKQNLAVAGMTLAVLGLMSAGMMGCAHSAHTRGSVALKHSAQEADVCLGKNEVKPGDKVALFKSECKSKTRVGRADGSTSVCTKVKLGDGEVAQVLDEHYSTIRVNSGVSFEEGTIVEKQ